MGYKTATKQIKQQQKPWGKKGLVIKDSVGMWQSEEGVRIIKIYYVYGQTVKKLKKKHFWKELPAEWLRDKGAKTNSSCKLSSELP